MSVTIVTPDALTEEWRVTAIASSRVFVISDTKTLLYNPNDGPFVRFVRLMKWASETIDRSDWRIHWVLARPSFDTVEGRKVLLNLHSLRSRLWTLRDWSPEVFEWIDKHSSVSVIDDSEMFYACKDAAITVFDGDAVRLLRARSVPYGYVERVDDVEFAVDTLPQAISNSMTISRFIELF